MTYIRSLLDVTDNLVDGTVVHPDRVRVRDEDDTYLVVAADKGTATFSDTANRVSAEYGFWLDDAFASGGSVGYDHKKLGITARGAWSRSSATSASSGSTRRPTSSRRSGSATCPATCSATACCCRTRSSCSRRTTTGNVFVDPDPDPAASFAERRRLFELAGSSWEDHSRDVLSEGGGVFKRDAKWIELPRAPASCSASTRSASRRTR